MEEDYPINKAFFEQTAKEWIEANPKQALNGNPDSTFQLAGLRDKNTSEITQISFNSMY